MRFFVVLLAVWRLVRGGVAQPAKARRSRCLLPAEPLSRFGRLRLPDSAGQGLPQRRLRRLRLWTGRAVVLCILAAGASWERVRSAAHPLCACRAGRGACSARPHRVGFRAALARRLGDPTLELLLPSRGRARLVDAAGRLPRPHDPGRRSHRWSSGGRELAVSRPSPGVFRRSGTRPGGGKRRPACARQRAPSSRAAGAARRSARLRARISRGRRPRAPTSRAGPPRWRPAATGHAFARDRVGQSAAREGTDRRLVDPLERADSS